MDSYKETFETWNKVASLYEDKFMNLDIYNASYQFFCKAIPKPCAKIFEIGCGPGNNTKYLLSKRPDFNVFGIDIAPNMIALAQKNNPSANFALMDCRKIDHIKSKFDGIVCGFCLPYLSYTECQKLIKDCHSLLHQNGLLYLSFVEGDPIKSGFQAGSTGDRCYFYFHQLADIKASLIQNHFEEINSFKVEYKKPESKTEIHTVLIARKTKL